VVEHGLELGGLLTCQLDIAELALTEQSDFASLALVGHGNNLVARGRNFGKALDLDRRGRPGAGNRLAVFVQHGTYTTMAGTSQHGIAARQRTALDKN